MRHKYCEARTPAFLLSSPPTRKSLMKLPCAMLRNLIPGSCLLLTDQKKKVLNTHVDASHARAFLKFGAPGLTRSASFLNTAKLMRLTRTEFKGVICQFLSTFYFRTVIQTFFQKKKKNSDKSLTCSLTLHKVSDIYVARLKASAIQ